MKSLVRDTENVEKDRVLKGRLGYVCWLLTSIIPSSTRPTTPSYNTRCHQERIHPSLPPPPPSPPPPLLPPSLPSL
ncbi:hypothetical protein PoB_002226000 [Plakobranchus ocellatus]|uniref:Uncharacterized protein n=1 Tax=Plakobranchus ocellatus TaxID=259542 RepID=A0AAV3ZMI1_9GAST|nr:hypothetical protein PoB_002226000 [Plakobranchus ocellatus]